MVNYFINLAIKWIYRILVLFCSLTVQYNTTASGASPTTLKGNSNNFANSSVFRGLGVCYCIYEKKN